VESKWTPATQIPPSPQTEYDANLKLMVIGHSKHTINCKALRTSSNSKSNMQQWNNKSLLLGASSTIKSFCEPNMGYYEEVKES
jgi:hypothetical protein